MKVYMKDYIEKIDDLIRDGKVKDIDSVIEQHLIKIKFFMHERLVHLLVTMLFAILTIITFLYTIEEFSFGLFLLTVLFLILLVPYIFHYYHLENGVQHMYDQYDLLIGIKNNK